jgi:hypothetical protein
MAACADECLDLVVIGAGPHSLALLSRLLCATPDTFDEHAHARLHSAARARPAAAAATAASKPQLRFAVVDRQGWLRNWQGYFDALSIEHLRSALLAHPDAA